MLLIKPPWWAGQAPTTRRSWTIHRQDTQTVTLSKSHNHDEAVDTHPASRSRTSYPKAHRCQAVELSQFSLAVRKAASWTCPRSVSEILAVLTPSPTAALTCSGPSCWRVGRNAR